MRRNWSEIMPELKRIAYDIYRQESRPIMTKHLWYAVVGSCGIQDTKSDYTTFKRVIVAERRRDPDFFGIFEDEDRYRDFHGLARFWDDQPHRVIISTEKNSMRRRIDPFVEFYRTGEVITRGSISETVMREMEQHMDEQTVVIHLGDFNPKGYEIVENLQTRLGKTRVVPLALKIEHVERYKLPRAIVKGKGSRKKWNELWQRNKWPTAEIDALAQRHPDVFKEIVVREIVKRMDAQRMATKQMDFKVAIEARHWADSYIDDLRNLLVAKATSGITETLETTPEEVAKALEAFRGWCIKYDKDCVGKRLKRLMEP